VISGQVKDITETGFVGEPVEDMLNQFKVLMITGAAQGQWRCIASNDRVSGGVVLVSPFDVMPEVGDEYRIFTFDDYRYGQSTGASRNDVGNNAEGGCPCL
jgi:hypothetical protein